MIHERHTQRRGRALTVLAAGTASTLLASAAHADFRLISPAGQVIQSAGGSITVQIEETKFYPGHYRVALQCPSLSTFPNRPVVRTGTDSQCGSVDIEQNPVLPVLADGTLQHTEPFIEPQWFQVKLPPQVAGPCELQVLEFMSGRNQPCFFDHDVRVLIQPTPSDAGSGSGGSAGAAADAGTDSDASTASGGCSCSVVHSDARSLGATSFVALAFFTAKRRRRPRA
jgi:MYXO-CTERM domain-containing protein